MPSLADLLDPPNRSPKVVPLMPAIPSVGLDGKRRRSGSTKALTAALAVLGAVPIVSGVVIALAPLVLLAQSVSSLSNTGSAGGFILLAFAPLVGMGLILLLASFVAGLLVILLGVPLLIAARVVWNKSSPPNVLDPEPASTSG